MWAGDELGEVEDVAGFGSGVECASEADVDDVGRLLCGAGLFDSRECVGPADAGDACNDGGAGGVWRADVFIVGSEVGLAIAGELEMFRRRCHLRMGGSDDEDGFVRYSHGVCIFAYFGEGRERWRRERERSVGK